MRLAYADRDKYLADPDFVRVPVAGLIDPAYLASRSALISPDRTMRERHAGTPAGARRLRARLLAAEAGTSHFVAVDRWGNVASETSTIESSFGSGLMVNGYYLNNELTDFSFVPEGRRLSGRQSRRGRQASAQLDEPDDRLRAGRQRAAGVGAAGGATIIAQVAKAIIGVIDWQLSRAGRDRLADDLRARHETVYRRAGTYLEAMGPQLQALGHGSIDYRPPTTFKANAIECVNGRWVGAADPRSEGAAVSRIRGQLGATTRTVRKPRLACS